MNKISWLTVCDKQYLIQGPYAIRKLVAFITDNRWWWWRLWSCFSPPPMPLKVYESVTRTLIPETSSMESDHIFLHTITILHLWVHGPINTQNELGWEILVNCFL